MLLHCILQQIRHALEEFSRNKLFGLVMVPISPIRPHLMRMIMNSLLIPLEAKLLEGRVRIEVRV